MKDDDEGDTPDTESAASMRKMLMNQVRRTPNPLFQSLMELERLGSPFNLETTLNYDDDTSDLEGL